MALYQAPSDSSFYKPYLDSLPTHYETLFDWTEAQISNYLAGTTLGQLIQQERQQNALQTRYVTSVRPILKEHGLISRFLQNEAAPSQEEFDLFQDACVCISTRAFDLSTETGNNDSDVESHAFNGPFLLPLIDLLNHDCRRRKSTTLRSDGHSFYMTAERDIGIDEEVVHSYGDQLCAAQFLQTFGFVPDDAVQFVGLALRMAASLDSDS